MEQGKVLHVTPRIQLIYIIKFNYISFKLLSDLYVLFGYLENIYCLEGIGES